MDLPVHGPFDDRYSVEVSGWDEAEAFFVEKSELEWNERSGKLVVLHRKLPEGTYVFVRLLQATSAERVRPVAYAARCECSRPNGEHQFQLTLVRPRNAETGQIRA